MKRQYNILIGDNSVRCGLLIADHLRGCEYNVFCRRNNCDVIYSAVASINPDVLILKCNNHDGDTEEIIRKISDDFCEVCIIVISNSYQIEISSDLINKGAFMFVPMPLSRFDILHCIEHSVSRCINITSFQRKILSFMYQKGFPVYLNGCSYIACAVENCLGNPDLIKSITSKMYPIIAQQFDISIVKVERSIRHVIDVFMQKGASRLLLRDINPNVPFEKISITNSELIVAVADIFYHENKNDADEYIEKQFCIELNKKN